MQSWRASLANKYKRQDSRWRYSCGEVRSQRTPRPVVDTLVRMPKPKTQRTVSNLLSEDLPYSSINIPPCHPYTRLKRRPMHLAFRNGILLIERGRWPSDVEWASRTHIVLVVVRRNHYIEWWQVFAFQIWSAVCEGIFLAFALGACGLKA